MAQTIYHPSVEGAQHGGKNLTDFLAYAKKAGAAGAQPSNYMLQAGDGFKSAKEIQQTFEKAELKLDGVSAHCPFWVHTSAWTGTPGIRPFIPADVAKQSPEKIEKWSEDYLLGLLDLCVELGVKIVPMFWGVAFGWEVAGGYPWGFWKGGDYDMIQEAKISREAARVPEAEVLRQVEEVYDRGQTLDALRRAETFAPLHQWQGARPCVLAARIAANAGAPRLATKLTVRARKADPGNGEALAQYGYELLSRRGPLALCRVWASLAVATRAA